MKYLITLLTLLPTLALAAPRVDLHLMSGVHLREDDGFDIVSEDIVQTSMNLGAAVRVGWLWVGIDYQLKAQDGELYLYEMNYLSSGLSANVGVRMPLVGTLSAIGTVGPTLRFIDLTIDGQAAEAWTLGARLAGGLEYALPTLNSAGGLRLEAYYERSLPYELGIGGTVLGDLDGSGAGLMLGFFVQL